MAPRKTDDVQVTPSKDAILKEAAGEFWSKFYKEPEQAEDEDDTAFNTRRAKTYQDATDSVAVLVRHLRKFRDDAKPVIRARVDTDEALEAAIGEKVSELGSKYIQFPLNWDENGNPLEGESQYMQRASIPDLRTFAEVVNHPFHAAATNFLRMKGLRFVQKEKAKGSKGKPATYLERADPKAKNKEETKAA